MTDQQSTRQLILDTGERIFADHCDKALLDSAEQGQFAEGLWQQVAENGFNHLGCADSGTDLQDLYAFVMLSGRFAVPLPIAETMLVNRWCGPVDGVCSIGIVDGREIKGVAWGRRANKVVGIRPDSSEICVVDNPQVTSQSANMAGEPRDTIALVPDCETITLSDSPYAQLAIARANAMAGSLQTMMDLGILFATERVQFGRSISKFQAIQHSLAVVAAEVAAARRAADAAVDALGTDRLLPEVAASKARVGEAVGVVAEQVHQVHGAMGFTHEHRLHHFSRRAWAWRDEFGNEFFWQGVLGRHLAGLGADGVWGFIATRG